MKHPSFLAVTIVGLIMAGSAFAQFGGDEGDVVLFVLTHRGPMNFQTAAPGAQNTGAAAARYRTTNLSGLPSEFIAPGFDARKTQIAVNEADDRFELVTQAEGIAVPRSVILGTSKVFTLQGRTRDENPGGQEAANIISGALALFTGGVVIGPEVALEQFRAIFWRPEPSGPPFREVDSSFVGPFRLPAGVTGIDYQLSIAKVPLFIRWNEMRKQYPGAGWPAGVDIKLLEEDRGIPSTIQLLRLRPGRRTPSFSLPARTHIFVLQGSAEITALGGSPTRMNPFWHAYLPAGFSISLSNPKQYQGPGANPIPN